MNNWRAMLSMQRGSGGKRCEKWGNVYEALLADIQYVEDENKANIEGVDGSFSKHVEIRSGSMEVSQSMLKYGQARMK